MVWHIGGGWKKYQRLIVGGGVGWGGGAVGIVGGLEKRILMAGAGGELGFKLLFSFLF